MHYAISSRFAWGNETGVKKEWNATNDINSFFTGNKTAFTGKIPWVSILSAGDFIEATIEIVILPQKAEHYYGPNLNYYKYFNKMKHSLIQKFLIHDN